jgi:VanZ family protein
MRILFSLISIFYISGIFLLAGSPFISKIATFNLFSLLHIPLYGILTVFLVFSFFPLPRWRSYSINHPNQKDQANRFLFAGLIALGVAIADEVHQTYIPGREASFTDVFLDAIGIALVLLLIHRIFRWKISTSTRPT